MTDVAILHLIITRAHDLPHVRELPFRALFEAYDAVLHECGLDPDHDPVFFRFLLRLGGISGSGTLYEKFEALLEEMGIRIEFAGEQSELPNVSDGPGGADIESETQRQNETSPRPRSRRASFSLFEDTVHEMSIYETENRPRRASFSSFYDAGDEATQRHQGAADRAAKDISFRSKSKPIREYTTAKAHSRKGIRSGPDRGPSSPARLQAASPKARIGTNISPRVERYRPENLDPPTAKHVTRLKQQSIHPMSRHGEENGDERELSVGGPLNATNDVSREKLRQARDRLTPQLMFRPSESQLSLQSEMFYHHCITRVARCCLRRWHKETVQILPQRYRFDLDAKSHDRRTLLQQAFDIWRGLLQRKRHRAETERFFSHLNRRAEKARDLYLLTKAFTHWAQTASEEVARTSVARRHILRTK